MAKQKEQNLTERVTKVLTERGFQKEADVLNQHAMTSAVTNDNEAILLSHYFNLRLLEMQVTHQKNTQDARVNISGHITDSEWLREFKQNVIPLLRWEKKHEQQKSS